MVDQCRRRTPLLELRASRWSSRAWAVSSALWLRSPTSTFGSAPASGGRCSAPTAPARRRYSTPSPATFLPIVGAHPLFRRGRDALPRARADSARTAPDLSDSQLFAGLTVIDSIFVACRGVSRGRLSLTASGRGRRADDAGPNDRPFGPTRRYRRKAGVDLQPRSAAAARNRFGAHRRAAIHPVRRARGRTSPAERRELVAILNALPAHIGYIIIEHDLDVALRVPSYVTIMHNGRVFKEGAPQEIEDDDEVQAIYLGRSHG